jgi:uncharacterized membrane protein YjfL (UPF0719 family)
MNSKLTLLAIIEILSALSMGVAILAATYLLIKYIWKKRYDVSDSNQAFGVVMASILFSVGYIVSSVVHPLLSLFRILSIKDNDTFHLMISFIGYGAIYIALAYVVALIVCWLGMTIYNYITPIDEIQELKNNNLAVALVVGSIIITLSLMTHDGVELLIESFIPYPNQYPK